MAQTRDRVPITAEIDADTHDALMAIKTELRISLSQVIRLKLRNPTMQDMVPDALREALGECERKED